MSWLGEVIDRGKVTSVLRWGWGERRADRGKVSGLTDHHSSCSQLWPCKTHPLFFDWPVEDMVEEGWGFCSEMANDIRCQSNSDWVCFTVLWVVMGLGEVIT